MERKILEKEDCHKAIANYLKNPNHELTKFEIVNFHNPYQGLVGEHFTLKVEFKAQNEPQNENFFVKTLSTNPFMLEFSKHLEVYEKEAFFYKMLEEYQKHDIDTSFAPRGLFFKPYVTVLEDLSARYKGTPKRQLLDFDHCEKSLEIIAKFHASTIIYEKKKEEELGHNFSINDQNSEILEDKLASQEETMATKWMVAAVEGLFQLIDLVLVDYTTNDDFKAKLFEILSLEKTDGLISTILHGDLWTSNFLYSYENGRPVEVKLLDFQLLKYGPVEQDVAEFLMTNTTRAFRAVHSAALIEHYYKKLKECLVTSGVHDGVLPPLADFLTSCNNFQLAAKIHAVVDHSYTFMADEIYGDVMRSEQGLREFLFEERSRYIVEEYNSNAEFRRVLGEDVAELRDLIFS